MNTLSNLIRTSDGNVSVYVIASRELGFEKQVLKMYSEKYPLSMYQILREKEKTIKDINVFLRKDKIKRIQSAINKSIGNAQV